ncbi:MAG: hypothetical protein ABI615_01885 [Chthoniobacterales bacterium]
MNRLLLLALLFLSIGAQAQTTDFTEKECPSAKATLAIPKGWHFFELKNSDGGVSYLVTKEKVSSEYDSFNTGMTLNIIKSVEKTGMKASEHAKSLVDQSQEKDEESKVETKEEAPFKVFKTTQTLDMDDGKLVMVTVFKANDQTGTLYHFTGQYPQKEEAQALEIWNEILKRTKLDPTY